MRVFENRRLWSVDEETLECALVLAARAIPTHWSLDAIVAIRRGGVMPGERLANLLGLPIHFASARHNLTDQIQSRTSQSVKIGSDFGDVPKHQRVLVVDDVCGTGRTLRAVTDTLLQTRSSRGVKTFVLCLNAGCIEPPDMWAWSIRDWVVFPWESQPAGEKSALVAPVAVQLRS